MQFATHYSESLDSLDKTKDSLEREEHLMELRRFLDLHDSVLTAETDVARAEFDRRQDKSLWLARRLRTLIIEEIQQSKPHLQFLDDSAFYGNDPSDARGGERFFALLTPVTLKKRGRLLDKLRRYLEERPDVADDIWWSHAKDLARFRVVTANLHDLLAVRDLIAALLVKLRPEGRFYLRDMPKDFIWVKQNERHNSSKSIHYLICDAEGHIVEVQIMTLLQYSWDQIEHWLYEVQRSVDVPHPIHASLDRSYWALSNSLFVLDEYILTLDRRPAKSMPKPFRRDLARCIWHRPG
jgi:ppGpp synthetase/RelA/SpoT-type nucleotidyltranferase